MTQAFGPKDGPRTKDQRELYDWAKKDVMKALKKKPAADKKCIAPKEHSSILSPLLDHVSIGVDVGGHDGRKHDDRKRDDKSDEPKDAPKQQDDSPHD